MDAEAIAYIRAKVDAALDRPELRAANGEIRIGRAAAHHVEQPWSAGIEIRVGDGTPARGPRTRGERS
ncbi:hypothetical protein [Streptomyces sp. NPDC005538]|uniref:hypothetical protein n=1 Tax=unclassified Streptomyces TaxID=2593676 RepID=UPI0033BA4F47